MRPKQKNGTKTEHAFFFKKLLFQKRETVKKNKITSCKQVSKPTAEQKKMDSAALKHKPSTRDTNVVSKYQTLFEADWLCQSVHGYLHRWEMWHFLHTCTRLVTKTPGFVVFTFRSENVPPRDFVSLQLHDDVKLPPLTHSFRQLRSLDWQTRISERRFQMPLLQRFPNLRVLTLELPAIPWFGNYRFPSTLESLTLRIQAFLVQELDANILSSNLQTLTLRGPIRVEGQLPKSLLTLHQETDNYLKCSRSPRIGPNV